MSDAKPVHGKSVLNEMDEAKENICAETESLKEDICIEVEPPKVHDITLKKKKNDPASLWRKKTYKLLNHFIDATPWAYALSCATLFMIPLIQCIDVQCMGHCLPLNVCNLWYTNVVVIILIILLNLLLAALLCVKSDLVKLFTILNYTLLVFYYVLGLVLYIAIQPHDTHLALHVFGITCAIVFPSLILSRSMTKERKVRLVYVAQA